MTRSWYAFLLALAFAPLGCEPVEAPAEAVPFSAERVNGQLGQDVGMTRRWSDYVGSTPMTSTERAIETATGEWAVDLLSLNGKPVDQITDPDAQVSAAKLGKKLDGGFGRYAMRGRDFRIRNWDLFVVNYGWSLISSNTTVAGRSVHVADVWPLNPGGPKYTVWVDQETGLTLKALEFLPTGELATEMEVLALEWNPDLTGVELHAPLPKTAIDPATIPSLVPFKTFHLSYVPAGFALLSSSLGAVGTGTALTQTYTDGVQELVLAQYADQTPSPHVSAIDAGTPIAVHFTADGARVQSIFSVLGTTIHVASKLTTDESMNVIESLTPNP